jgi:hypothetical protein
VRAAAFVIDRYRVLAFGDAYARRKPRSRRAESCCIDASRRSYPAWSAIGGSGERGIAGAVDSTAHGRAARRGRAERQLAVVRVVARPVSDPPTSVGVQIRAKEHVDGVRVEPHDRGELEFAGA